MKFVDYILEIEKKKKKKGTGTKGPTLYHNSNPHLLNPAIINHLGVCG